jgi:hypothetical protein
MASKRTQTPALSQPPSFPPSKAIELLKRQIESGIELLKEQYLDSDPYEAWKSTTVNFLIKSFGAGNQNIEKFEDAARIWFAPSNATEEWWADRRSSGLRSQLALLESYIAVLNADVELIEFETSTQTQNQPKVPSSNKIFIVHGHNDSARETCARLLEKLGLEPIILHEKPNSGRTIIEKFHDYSDVGFAVVILTGDDKGGTKDADFDSLKLRASITMLSRINYFRAKFCLAAGTTTD